MTTYLVVARDDPKDFQGLSPEEIQAIIERYKTWSRKVSQAVTNMQGNKLRNREGRVLRGKGEGLRVTDGPYSETKEVIGGYWLIEAESYDRIIDLVKGCPHLDFGTLEIRAIEDV